ncbi:hypothetical protein R1flu_019921 [Riccia fluitans]|uniref:Reticulon-like protein n=1 Tax=Riccia fluitans TaxID=41844 RepID=A0ABD1ZK04_9MARC
MASSSPPRRFVAATDVASSGVDSGVKFKKKGPTRSNSACARSVPALEAEAVGSSAAEVKLLGGRGDWNAGSGINHRSLSFRGEIAADRNEKETADAGGKGSRLTRAIEISELQDQSLEFGRLSGAKSVKRLSRRTRSGSQELFQDQVMETFSRSQSKVRETRATRSRPESPKRHRTEEDNLQVMLVDMISDQSLIPEKPSHTRTTKGIRQRSKAENEDFQNVEVPSKIPDPALKPVRSLRVGAEIQEENQIKATGRRTKTTTRRHSKKKFEESNDHSSDEGAELAIAGHQRSNRLKEPRQHTLGVSKTRAPTSSRFASATWVQLIGDVIMWKDIPRSTLFFGVGCFGILSTSYMRSTGFGVLTITCYLALAYLAGIYCHRSFLGGMEAGDRLSCELSDSDLLDMVKVVLPAVNLVVSKCRQLFCGEPYTTLKVAAMLWVVAQLGYWVSLWSFARIAFVAVFVVPKFFSLYSHQLHGYAEVVAERMRTTWEECTHKKAAVIGSLFVTWNFTSSSTRLFGAFITLVAVRAYYGQVVQEELAEGARNGFENIHREKGLPPVVSVPQETMQGSYLPLKEMKMEPS